MRNLLFFKACVVQLSAEMAKNTRNFDKDLQLWKGLKMNEKCQVLILGAGMAGLSAAAHLVQNGLDNVQILEARDRIGGRFLVQNHNRRNLHMGAQWVHGICPENALFCLAQKHGILDLEMERDGFGDMDFKFFALDHFYQDGGVLIEEKLVEKAGNIYSKICQNLQDLHNRQGNT